jgi:O-antigen/teichoic acid export membrane protein
MTSSLLDVFAANLYLALIGKMFSLRDAGLFSRARNTHLMPVVLIISVVHRVAYSAFSSVAEDKARLVRGLRQAQAVAMFINIPVMVGIIVLAEPLVLTLFGEQWLPCVPILQVLGWGGILWPLSILNLNVLIAQGHSGLKLRLEVIKKVTAIILTVAASYYGVMAIAWAQVVISICAYHVNTYYTKVLLNYSGLSQLRDLTMNFVAAIPMAAVVYVITEVMQTLPLIELAVAGTVGCGVYLLTCRVLCADILNQSLVLTGVRTSPVQI